MDAENNSGVDEEYQELDRRFSINNLFLKTMHELLAKGENQNALVPYVDRMRENLCSRLIMSKSLCKCLR